MTPSTAQRDIREGLDRLDIGKGAEVMVHSSLSSFGIVEGGAPAVIQALRDQVTGSGTVLMPAFVQKVNGQRASYLERKQAWNAMMSPSDVGFITETFRNTDQVLRSDHPTHSICARGATAEKATHGHRSAHGRPSPWSDNAFGIGSPWDWMVERDIHYLLMGVDFDVCTMLHYVQALFAERNGLYNEDPKQWPNFDFPAVGDRLKAKGIVDETVVGGSRWYHIRARSLVDEALGILEENPELVTPAKVVPFPS